MSHGAQKCAALLLPFHSQTNFFPVGHKHFSLQRNPQLGAYILYNQKLLTIRLPTRKSKSTKHAGCPVNFKSISRILLIQQDGTAHPRIFPNKAFSFFNHALFPAGREKIRCNPIQNFSGVRVLPCQLHLTLQTGRDGSGTNSVARKNKSSIKLVLYTKNKKSGSVKIKLKSSAQPKPANLDQQ